MSVYFANHDVDFELHNDLLIRNWISKVVSNHGKKIGKISYLFCSDSYIIEINNTFLHHDTFTDIITFDYVEGNLVSGDILISVDRVRDNAAIFDVPFSQELYRVIIHGVLHLLGFKDKADEDAKVMRKKEEESLLLLSCME